MTALQKARAKERERRQGGQLRISGDDESGTGDPLNDPPEVETAAAAERMKGIDDGPILPLGSVGTKSRFNFVGSAAFAGGDFRPEWLITHALVRNQPGVIAGPSKALKTNLSIDLAVSLAAGDRFLGKFDVPKRTRVAVVSGESGAHTLQETALRVCRAKGIELSDQEHYLDWCFDLPTFSDLDVMDEFGAELTKLNAEVVIIDPVYLAMGSGIDMKNLVEAGNAFRVVADVLLKAGCTPLLVHHANRQLQVGEPMELTNLAYSGLEQFARQFFLLNRREKYQGNGTHDLWLSVGGSAGHGGLWALHIEEGTVDENFTGRRWEVSVKTRAEVQGDVQEQRQEAKREASRKKEEVERNALLLALDAEVKCCGAATRTRLKERTGFSTAKVSTLIGALAECGAIIPVDFHKPIGSGATIAASGFKRADVITE